MFKNPLSNFTDPFGLVGRMLKSGHPAAYAALFREGLRLGAIPVDSVLSVFEKRIQAKCASSQLPLVFIVGAPRSGTTLVYQALSAFLDVTCPTNLTAMFPKSPLTAARLQRLIPWAARPDFKNFYGQTTRFRGPNDAFHLWNRWLGEDRYLPAQDISDDAATEMCSFFDAWTSVFGKPLLNKNNRNAFAIDLLGKALPNARFVVERRNPLFVAQSLIVARENIQGDKSLAWGLQSASITEAGDPLAYVDEVCRQVIDIDVEMDRQLATVADSRILNLTYEGFCENPGKSIKSIADKFDGLQLNPRLNVAELPPFKVSQKLSISEEEQVRVRECLSGGQAKYELMSAAAITL